MVDVEFDLYDALNLSRDASVDDVRSAFRELSRLYHPDKQAGGEGEHAGAGGDAAFMRVHRAYRVLGDDVLRKFYDRYGLPGVRLAESLSDDEDDEAGADEVGSGRARPLSVPDDRLRELEGRVLQQLRKHHELQTQRLLALQGTFTFGVAARPLGPLGAHMPSRYRLQYSAVTQSVQIALSDQFKMNVGCMMHVQGANGLGVGKLTLGAFGPLGSLAGLRASLNVAGSAPELDVSLTRAVTPHCAVQQKVSISSDGATLSVAAHPWLTRTVRGSLGASFGEDPSLVMGLVKRSTSSGHSAKVQLNLQPSGGGEITAQLKYKPVKHFSIKLAPAITPRGWAVQVMCSKAFRDGLTKLQWNIRIQSNSATLRLVLHRAGLRFAFPLELWPKAAGPLPAREICLAVAFWALPPIGLRCLRALWMAVQPPRAALEASVDDRVPTGDPQGDATESSTRPAQAAADDASAVAAEQRRLVAREADRRRSEEAAQNGLEIVVARYGDPASAAAPGPAQVGVIDVTDCLMAKVRRSHLHISSAPKSSLLGFGDPSASRHPAPALYVRYRFGGVVHESTFGETEPVLLP